MKDALGFPVADGILVDAETGCGFPNVEQMGEHGGDPFLLNKVDQIVVFVNFVDFMFYLRKLFNLLLA